MTDNAMNQDAGLEFDGPHGKEPIQWIEEGILRVPYIPDFRAAELVFYFVPDRRRIEEVYHSLPPRLVDRWSAYFTKKGWKFIHADPASRQAEGPFKVRPGKIKIDILEPGRLFAPKPQFRFKESGDGWPVVSLEKRRPFDPWKPTYIRALNFIKKYEFIREVPKVVDYCLWEIEEGGEVAGSTGWENAELILSDHVKESAAGREVLADIFEKRPEDFPLGSEVYLRVLGRSGPEGFQKVCDLARHPQRLKRCHVARSLGRLRRPEALSVLLQLADDEDPEVRGHALCAIGKVGLPPSHPAAEKIRRLLESTEVPQRVWAAEALLRGGDQSQEKFLLQLVKECPMPLHDMGELGEILVDLKMVHSVPFLINRLKSDRVELCEDAVEVLRGLTGLDLEFHPHGEDETERRQAIREWNRWWEEYKKTRRHG